MRNTKAEYTLTERLMVVAILLTVTLVAAQNLLQSVKESEERTMNSAVIEYAGVKNMYAQRPAVVPPPTIQATVIDTEAFHNTQSK